MENITTSWGETLPLTVEAEDADNATLYIGEISNPIVTVNANFIEGSADISASATEMEIAPDTYNYQIVVEYDDGSIRKYPDVSDCEDCTLPTITVCPTIDMPEGS
jgi:hypothetical protein